MNDIWSSQSALWTWLHSPSTRSITLTMPTRLASMASSVRTGRAPFLSDGSPTRVVASPKSTIGRCPCAFRWRSAIIWIIEPTWSDGAVRSNPM